MTAWARSGRRSATSRDPRPSESWALALRRARETWDGLTPPRQDLGTGRYSEFAAAAIVQLAVALWADTAAALTAGDDRPDG